MLFLTFPTWEKYLRTFLKILIFQDVPTHQVEGSSIEDGWKLIDALVDAGSCSSKSQARKLIQSGGVYINNEQCKEVEYLLTKDDLASESCLIKKTECLLWLA